MDFFNERLTPKDLEMLVKGARDAAKQDNILKEQWFNNRTVFFIPRDRRGALTDEAYQQADVVLRQPGLTVLAGPCYYAFCCKVDRIAGGGLHPARPYDLADAITYLRAYLRKSGQNYVSRATMQTCESNTAQNLVQVHTKWSERPQADIGLQGSHNFL